MTLIIDLSCCTCVEQSIVAKNIWHVILMPVDYQIISTVLASKVPNTTAYLLDKFKGCSESDEPTIDYQVFVHNMYNFKTRLMISNMSLPLTNKNESKPFPERFSEVFCLFIDFYSKFLALWNLENLTTSLENAGGIIIKGEKINLEKLGKIHP